MFKKNDQNVSILERLKNRKFTVAKSKAIRTEKNRNTIRKNSKASTYDDDNDYVLSRNSVSSLDRKFDHGCRDLDARTLSGTSTKDMTKSNTVVSIAAGKFKTFFDKKTKNNLEPVTKSKKSLKKNIVSSKLFQKITNNNDNLEPAKGLRAFMIKIQAHENNINVDSNSNNDISLNNKDKNDERSINEDKLEFGKLRFLRARSLDLIDKRTMNKDNSKLQASDNSILTKIILSNLKLNKSDDGLDHSSRVFNKSLSYTDSLKNNLPGSDQEVEEKIYSVILSLDKTLEENS